MLGAGRGSVAVFSSQSQEQHSGNS